MPIPALKGVNQHGQTKTITLEEPENNNDGYKYKMEIVWSRVIILGLLHLIALYGLCIKYEAKIQTTILAKIIAILASLGVTGGAHRLWSHKCYKANYGVQILLMLMMSMTYQNSIFTWCRDHRLHHKYSETDADPHNAKRGFFFSHVGWLMVRKHKLVVEKGREIDLSDLKANPIVMFQHRHYHKMVFLLAVFPTTFVPMYFWGESLKICIVVATIYRYISSVNVTWGINSLAHLYGNKPYSRRIGPTENTIMKYCGFGEGFHNYHHTFPWDYKTGEYGDDVRNITTTMIDMFAWFGWVTERKTATQTSIDNLVQDSGDGTHEEVPESQRFYVKHAIIFLLFVILI